MFRKNKEKPSRFKLISKTLSLVFVAISAISIYSVAKSNLLPSKYFYPSVAILVILNLLFLHAAFKCRTKIITNLFCNFLIIVISAGLLFANLKFNEITGFINDNFKDTKKYSVYNIIVKKESKTNSPSDLNGTEVFTYEEPVKEVSNEALKEAVKNTISDSTLIFKEDLDTVMERAANMTDVASVINNGTYESYISVNEDYAEKIKIIGEIKIEITGEVDNDVTDAKTLANTPFILFINGIDTRTGTMPTRSLSDVNIVAAVNPNTKKITLVAIPRDTYVQLHGIGGLKDKLTHSGSRGGVKLTVATIEDFLGIKVDRYIRVNFNFVTGLVDNIGGITVTNDLNRTLKLNGCTYEPGDNEVDGKCALRFARERKSYNTGDRHRGENQEQVITRIIEKVSHDKSIIMDSSKILSALDGSFNSNITADDISALVRMQLNDMSSWKVESYNVNGKGQLTKTNSYPNRNLYVMVPDQNTVNTAKAKINKTLSE